VSGPAALRRSIVAAAVGGLALLAQVPSLDRGVVPLDEGQLVTIADRLLGGELLYRDVYTGIFPGIYYLTAALLRVFGEDVLVTRWAAAVVNAAIAVGLWLAGCRAMRPGWALLAPALYVALVPFAYPALTMFNYSPLAMVCAVWALVFLLRYLETARLSDAAVAGLLLGACGLVKQNFGALASLAVALGYVAGRAGGAPLARRSLLGGILPIALCAVAPALLAGAVLAAAGALPGFLHDTLFSIGESQMQAFNDPIPPIFGPHPQDDGRFVFAYTPSSLYAYLVLGKTLFGLGMSPGLRSAAIRLAYGGALATLLAGVVLLAAEGSQPPERRRATRCVVIFAALMFLGLFPSAIWSHLAYVLAPVLLLFALVVERVAGALERAAPAAARGWAVACGAFCAAALAVGAQISVDLRRWYPEPLGVERGSLHVSKDQRALLGGAARFLERCAPAGEPVFVAPDMPLVYFLAGRRNPTPYDLIIPGAIDGALIVQRLTDTQTRCIVYNPKMYLQFAAFDELFPEVAAHLASDYRRETVIAGESTSWWGLVRERKRGS
jgi:uncharacterized membrane protein